MAENKKIVSVKGKEIGGQRPMVCTPLVGKDNKELKDELDKIIPKRPDMIEWRADYYHDLDDTQTVTEALDDIHFAIDGIPLLLTIRSHKEGGEEIPLNEEGKIQLMESLCATGKIDLIDYELQSEENNFNRLRAVSKEHGVKMIASYHNFELTPGPSTFIEKSKEAERREADIVKISVMPVHMEDVLLLLQATQNADRQVNIPLVTISMGRYGSITRMFGWMFGSTITFGIGEQSSAPGQIPIDDLRTAIQTIEKSIE